MAHSNKIQNILVQFLSASTILGALHAGAAALPPVSKQVVPARPAKHQFILFDGTGNSECNQNPTNIAKMAKVLQGLKEKKFNLDVTYIRGLGAFKVGTDSRAFSCRDSANYKEERSESNSALDINNDDILKFKEVWPKLAAENIELAAKPIIGNPRVSSAEGIKELVEATYRAKIDQIQENDTVTVFGFSRGAYEAYYFSRLFKEANQQTKKTVDLLAVYDTVESAGLADVIAHLTGLAQVGAKLPNTVAAHIIHFVAKDEQRNVFNYRPFETDTANPDRVIQVIFPGSHGDAGGGYGGVNLMSNLTLFEMRNLVMKKLLSIGAKQNVPVSSEAVDALAELDRFQPDEEHCKNIKINAYGGVTGVLRMRTFEKRLFKIHPILSVSPFYDAAFCNRSSEKEVSSCREILAASNANIVGTEYAEYAQATACKPQK